METEEFISEENVAIDPLVKNASTHFEKMFYFELQRRDELTKSAQGIVAILVALIGGIFFLAEKGKKLAITPYGLTLASLLIGISLVFFVLSQWPRKYGYLPTPDICFAIFCNEPHKLENLLLEKYMEAANFNRVINKKRSDYFSWGTTFLFFALGIEGIVGFFYFWSMVE